MQKIKCLLERRFALHCYREKTVNTIALHSVDENITPILLRPQVAIASEDVSVRKLLKFTRYTIQVCGTFFNPWDSSLILSECFSMHVCMYV